ncbi:MAG TPA: DUF1553 domain-containing protein, partial [Pirellulales bacterium]
VHREALDDKTIASRFRRVGAPRVVPPQPEVMPDLGEIPAGRVLVQFSEALPSRTRWLNEGESWPSETSRWLGDEFLLPRLPLRYDAWGVRTAWKAPLLVRLAADVRLPVGKARLLLRARDMGRLWIDGRLVARTNPVTKSPPDGEEPITPLAAAPLPGLRPHGYRQQEVFGEATIEPNVNGATGNGATESESSRLCRVVLELAVGGDGRRTETGEVCVAIENEVGRSFAILQPAVEQVAAMLPLTDAAVEPALSSIEASLSKFDDETRRQAASSQDEFWRGRHAAARAWAEQHPAPPVPETSGDGTVHPIDAFIGAKIERALAESSQSDARQTEYFHGQILPLLQKNCFRCHGEKDNGGLKLNSREAALKAGDSEVPAVVPGSPDASEMIVRIRSGEMPPSGDALTKDQIALLEKWVQGGAAWPAPPLAAEDVALAPVIGDEAFLRRVHLDLVGTPPTLQAAREFLADSSPDKRRRLVDRLLQDDGFADHWMSHWLDVLAENPTLLNASLNSTGPFRWFVYDALRDGKPLDRWVTELLLLRGSSPEGGSAGFGVASENDSPFAAKAQIAASAFLGIEMQCARCHDSPYHSTTQRDLYSLGAMLARQPLTVPTTSRVPAAFFEKQQRESLIRVTLKPGEPSPPEWPFATVTGAADDRELDRLMQQPGDSRERLAALITAPQNQRFPRVVVNMIWKRLIGAGLVEPAYDWEGKAASHPELLDWLAHELIVHDYDPRHVIRLIVASDLYQRPAVGRNLIAEPDRRFFHAPDRRRMTAEQVVDSLHVATGRPIEVEELTFVHDGRRPLGSRLTLGRPTRAWMFADLKNERDRPSLSLPRARAVIDVLEAFGWIGSRQKPITHREVDPNVLQPGVLANGTLATTLARASINSELAQLAVDGPSPEALVESLFLRVLTRRPTAEEQAIFARVLADGFDSRLRPGGEGTPVASPAPLPLVTWFNHLQPEANTIQMEAERRARLGPPADSRLNAEWRARYEDVVWSLINHREFVWLP